MIAGEQIRAARAYMGWSQTELAERADCSLSTIAKIERLEGDVSADILENIRRAFEKEGMFFTDDGLIKRSTAMYEIEGEGWWLRVLDDVYQSTLDKKGAEVLLFCADDRESPPEVTRMWTKIRNAGVAMRQLVREGNTFLLGPVKEYRWIPKEYFENYVTMVYGDKVCMCAENNTKAVIFRDRRQASTLRNLFNLLWNKLEEPRESTAPDRF